MENNKMIVEEAKMSQINELVKISKAAFDSDVEVGAKTKGGPPEYDKANWHIQMLKEGHLFSAIEDENLLGGAVVFLNKRRGELYIGRIFIDPKYHRKGYGIKLMKKLEERYRDCNRLYLDTPIWNSRTNAFYQKLGYTEIRRDKEFVYYKKELS